MSDEYSRSITGDPPPEWGNEIAKQTFVITMVSSVLFVGIVFLFIL